MPDVNSVDQALALMEERFDAGKAKGVNGTVQMELTGEEPSKWAVQIEDGEYKLIDGGVESPTTTLTMSTDDFLGMVNGTVNSMAAFMQGKIKLQGDMGLAMKFQSIFGIV
jgi:putative sterol carrier protein